MTHQPIDSKLIATLKEHAGGYIQIHKETGEYLGSGLDRKKRNAIKIDATSGHMVLSAYERGNARTKEIMDTYPAYKVLGVLFRV